MSENDLVIETLDGTLRHALTVPDRVIGLAELSALVLPIDDGLAALAKGRVLAQGKSVSCASGCAACCRQLVPISAAEAFLLADWVERADPSLREAIEGRFERRHEQLQKTWIGYALRERLAEEEPRATELAIAYHRLQIACPLLEDDRCLAYEARPAVCREYQVVTRKESCRFPGRAPIEEVAPALRMSTALAALSEAHVGEGAGRIPLLGALAFAASHREARALQWPARELVEWLVAWLRGERPRELPTER
jgi:Fe-S-cluster containining protein